MSKHTHGGNVYKYNDCIDFSANCNPLGTPERVIHAGIESLKKVSDYPQVGYMPLRKVIAEYENVKPDQIICGNGAAEIIFTLCHAINPKRALLPAPTFAEYQQALESCRDKKNRCAIEYYTLKEENGFKIREDFLDAIDDNLDIMFLCNPNNPTGVLTERTLLLKILKKCKKHQVFLVVDECFQDFIEKPETYTLKAELESYQNLFLLKAFTKRYAMAGIRLGYGLCGNWELLNRMEQCVQPWNISTIAQACGIAALKEIDYVEEGRRMIFEEKHFLCSEMEKLGLKIYASEANYIFFRGPKELFEKCIQKKILIRDCSNYEGLEQGFYRVAVKTHEDNLQLIDVLQKIVSNNKRW